VAVLVVEDYLPLARPLLRGLQEEGIDAHLARDDEEGDARIRTGPYDAVLVDWNIPSRGGAALVRRWRDNALGVPVLLLLPSADAADFRQGIEAGADDCLSLPFDFADLLARLRNYSNPSRKKGAPWRADGFSPSVSPQPLFRQ
jgi:two-component system, OmpR family, response regulator